MSFRFIKALKCRQQGRIRTIGTDECVEVSRQTRFTYSARDERLGFVIPLLVCNDGFDQLAQYAAIDLIADPIRSLNQCHRFLRFVAAGQYERFRR